MPLSLTTRRRQQTSNIKWSSQQHLDKQQQNNKVTTSTNNLVRHHYFQQPVRKEKSFIDTKTSNSYVSINQRRPQLSRGLSVGRSHDIKHSYNKQVLKKHSSITTHHFNGNNDRESLKTDYFIKKNITACGQSTELLQNSHRVQAWSTSSILKSLDNELTQLNGVVEKCKDVKIAKGSSDNLGSVKSIKTQADSITSSNSHSSSYHTNRKPTKSDINKVNLSIVLSHALKSTKEGNEFVFSDSEEEEGDYISNNSGKDVNFQTKFKDSKKLENTKKPLTTISTPARPVLLAQQRRALYHSTRLTTNLVLTNNNLSATNNSDLEYSQNFNASLSLTVQKRAPLMRAMSAPVHSFNEATKGSILASKRKSRRRKLNTRCNKGTTNPITETDLNLSKKVLTRSKSVTPDVITLVSLISSEGSDSEKEESSATPTNSHRVSVAKRAPSLRKTGKSVSFQENYPPTFQFASKEYSHMLRRGSIVSLAQHIKSNRPPTAPPGSVYHSTNKIIKEMNKTTPGTCGEKEDLTENISKSTISTSAQNSQSKTLEDEFKFPEYVHSLKERECWKLYMKMSTKGVNITYDTILRGMLTPTEFRQLQKQRELEEDKILKESEENAIAEDPKSKNSTTFIERFKDNLLKN